eukprot:jgi/Orpsp1_1/1180587/evm.model.c7180000073989.1
MAEKSQWINTSQLRKWYNKFNADQCRFYMIPTYDADVTDKLVILLYSIVPLNTAITDFIPAFFSPGGVLSKENEEKNKLSVLEIIIQSEDFFKEHPDSFKNDESKNSFVINKLTGTARRWG